MVVGNIDQRRVLVAAARDGNAARANRHPVCAWLRSGGDPGIGIS
jgi:hypothetical protein